MAKERQYQSCEICGGFFIPHSSRNLVCPECRTKDLTRRKVDMANLSKNMRKREIAGIAAKKISHTCPCCGKTFASAANIKFCSNGCERDFLKRTESTCLVCGKKVPDGAQCCSKECEKKLAFRLTCKDPRYGHCKECGRVFLKKKPDDEFCSRKCAWENYQKKYSVI